MVFNKSRRVFLRFCLNSCRYALIFSAITCTTRPRLSQSAEGSPPRPPSYGEKEDPRPHINENAVQERISNFIDDVIKGLKASGEAPTPEEVNKIREEAIERTKSILKQKGYEVGPPPPPQNFQVR